MTPEQLARYGQLKARSAPKSMGQAAATAGSTMQWLFGDPRPAYNKDYDSPEYRQQVDTLAADLRDDVAANKPNTITEAGNAAFLNLPAKGAAAIINLPALLDEREFGREYAATRDAWEKVRGERIEEKPTQALIEGLGGAIGGGYGFMSAGGKLAAGLANQVGGPVGAGVRALTTMPRGFGVMANLGRGAQNAALGAALGGAYAAGYDEDVEAGLRSGALFGPAGAAAFRLGAGVLRRAPVTVSALAGAGTAGLAGADKEEQGLAALGAGAIASQSGRRALGSAFKRLTRGGSVFGSKPQADGSQRLSDDFPDRNPFNRAPLVRQRPGLYKERLDRAQGLYNSGSSYVSIAERMGVNPPVAWSLVNQEAANTLRGVKNFSPDQLRDMVNGGLKLSEIVKIVGGSSDTRLTKQRVIDALAELQISPEDIAQRSEAMRRATGESRRLAQSEAEAASTRRDAGASYEEIAGATGSRPVDVWRGVRELEYGRVRGARDITDDDLVDMIEGGLSPQEVSEVMEIKYADGRGQPFQDLLDRLGTIEGMEYPSAWGPFVRLWRDKNPAELSALRKRARELYYDGDGKRQSTYEKVSGILETETGESFSPSRVRTILMGDDARTKRTRYSVDDAETGRPRGAQTVDDLTPVDIDDLKAGRRAVAEYTLKEEGPAAARNVLRNTRGLVGERGYSPQNSAAAASIVKSLGGVRKAFEAAGSLRKSWDRMNAALSERQALINQLRQEIDAEREIGGSLSRSLSERHEAAAALAEEVTVLAKSMNEARQAMARMQEALDQSVATSERYAREMKRVMKGYEEFLGAAEAGAGRIGQRGTVPNADAAETGLREAQATAQRVTSLEENFRQLENMGDLRMKASRAMSREAMEPGSISGNRKAATRYEQAGPLRQRIDRAGRRAYEQAKPELDAERAFAARRERAIALQDEAGRLRDSIDPRSPGAADLRTRLQRMMDQAQDIKERRYPGAERLDPKRLQRLSDDAGDAAGQAGDDAARVEQIRMSMRQTLDNMGLKDIDLDIVSDSMMRVLTGGKAAKGVYQAGRIILNAERFTGDTIGHEALHGLREMGVIRAKEYDALLNAAKKAIPKAERDTIRQRPAYKDLSEDDFNEEIVARYVGPKLEKIAKGAKPGNGMVGKVAQRIYDIGRGIREALTDAEVDPEEVVRRIGTGEVGGRSRNVFEPGVFDRMNRRFAGLAAYANPRTAEERARAEAANEFGIRLSKGQQSGDVKQLGKEDAYAAGSYGPGAQDTMEKFYGRQREQTTRAIDDVSSNLGLGAPTTNPLDAMVEVTEGVARRDAARRGWAGRKYRQLEEMGDKVQFSEPQSLGARLRQVLEDEFIAPGSKAERIVRMFEKALEKRSMSFADFRELRSKALAAKRSVAPQTTESFEISTVTRALDDWLDEAIEAGGLTAKNAGDQKAVDKALAKFRDANQYYRKYKEAFAVDRNATPTEKRAQKVIMMMADREIGPNEVLRDALGLGAVGGNGLSVRVLSNLEKILNYRAQEIKKAGFFTEDYLERIGHKTLNTTVSSANPKHPSPEWQAVRGAAFRLLTQAQPGKAEFGYRGMANRIDAFLNGNGKGAANILFEPEEREMIKRFAETLRAMDRQQGRFNPSGSGYTMYRLAYDLAQKIFGATVGYSLGEQLGGPGGGMAGAAAGFGAGSPVGRALGNLAGQRAAARATGPQAMPASPVVEGAINWGAARSVMASVFAGAGEIGPRISK